MHSCGEASAFIPDLIDAGLDVLEALQATTTLDIAKLRAQCGDQITFMGNISSVKMSESDEAIREEIERKVTAGKPGGGYIYHSNHSVPSDVPFERYWYMMSVLDRVSWYREKIHPGAPQDQRRPLFCPYVPSLAGRCRDRGM